MNKNYHLPTLLLAGLCLSLFALPTSTSAADLQYASAGLIGQESFGVTYSSPQGNTHFSCTLDSSECSQQETSFSPRPSTADIQGNVYWSPQNKYAVSERPLNVFDKYLYRVYRNEGESLTPVGYIPYYEKTTQLRFSQDESTLFLAAADGTTAKVPTTAPFKATTTTIDPQALGRWVLSPDGSLIAGYKQSGVDQSAPYTLVVQNLVNGEIVAEFSSHARHDIAINRDNQQIAHTDIADGKRIVAIRSLVNPESTPQRLADNGWVNHLVTSGNNFYFVANQEGAPYEYGLYRHDPSDNDTDRIEESIAETVSLQATPRQLLFGTLEESIRHIGQRNTQTGDTKVHELIAADKEGSQPAVRKQVVALDDNLTGVLLTPQARNPSKALVWLHGGPHRQASPGYNSSLIYGVYDELLHAFARAGWAVMKLDYTGSVGYSADYRDAIVNNIGAKDVADTQTAITWMDDEFDNPKMNLMGVSYGGYLSLKTAVESPQQVDRTVSVNGVTDWMTDTLIDPTFRVYFGGRPSPKTIDKYVQSSLIYDLENLQDTPSLALQSTEDTIVDPVQAALLDRVANKEGVPLTYNTIEGAPHTIQKQSHLNTLCESTTEFLSADGVCAMR